MLKSTFKKEINSLLPKLPKRLAVAVSGGADSMCLALLCQDLGMSFVAVIVDHGLRAESSKEAKQVSAQLERLGIPSTILKWEGQKPQSNIHENARRERYRLITDFCRENKIENLLVAHTKNDQAETVMLRIFRGSGIDGVAAMKKQSIKNHVKILRPLLNSSRDEIETYLKDKKVKWVDDPSNYNTKFERVKIRNLIASFPDKDLWIERLVLLSNNAQRSSSYIKQRVNKLYAKLAKVDNFGFISISFKKFSSLHDEVALKLLVKVLAKFGAKEKQPRLNSLVLCLENIRNKKDSALAGVEIKLVKDRVFFLREFRKISGLTKGCIWDYRFKVEGAIGLKIEPLSSDGWKQIKNKVMKKTWPHINVIYALPAVFKGKKVVSCPLLSIGGDKFKVKCSL